MNVLHYINRWLFGNEKSLARNTAIWNFISSVEYSLQSAILMMVITRINGLFDAGVFLIAYSVTQMMTTIGNYGMRSFQASDVKEEFSFKTYLSSRIVSVVAMVIICMSYSFLQHYDVQRLTIIVVLCGYRLVECVEDIFHGEMQRSLRLDVASKIWGIRIFLDTVTFFIAYVLTKDLLIASVSMFCSALLVSLVLNSCACKLFDKVVISLKWDNTLKLLWECLPVCIGGFLYTYLVNAPKYAIDRNMSEEMQTIFNILFMPVFVINMLSMFVYKPLIAKMGIQWTNHKQKELIRTLLTQVGVILAITIIVIVGGVVIGLDILGLLYGVKLSSYKGMFALLLLFGGFAALAAFFVVGLTVTRKQQYVLVAYLVALLVVLVSIDRLVIQYGLLGASISYGLGMGIVMFILGTALVITIIREQKKIIYI